jgi:pimeloyl-ACP methyl ester carboxylesterase
MFQPVMDQDVRLGDIVLRTRRVRSAGRESPVLIFLHDSLGSIETRRDFPQSLAQRAGLDALIYDRRGYGGSSPFGAGRRTTRYLHEEAGMLFALLDALGIGRSVLFGHSDGGSIALIAAAGQPGRVDAVITEGAHVFVEDATLRGVGEARAMFRSADLLKRLARYHGSKADAVVAAWIETWLSPEFREWNIESCLPRIACPVLAIQGQDDGYGTEAQIQAILRGAGPRARALILPETGHTPHRDAPAAVLDASVEFIASALA